MQDPESIVLCSAISEVFLRKLAKQGFIKYVEGSEIVDTRDDLVEMGDIDGGGLKELDEKLKTRIENLKDLVLYRFGSTGVVQVLSRAAQMLGLVPIFPVRNIHTLGSGSAGEIFCISRLRTRQKGFHCQRLREKNHGRRALGKYCRSIVWLFHLCPSSKIYWGIKSKFTQECDC